MDSAGDKLLLRVFVGDDDVFEDRPLAEAIVLKARAMELAGATVLRGTLGYGPASRQLQIVLRLSEDRPVVIEIVDSAEKVNRFVPVIAAMMGSGMMTLQPVTVLHYGARAQSAP